MATSGSSCRLQALALAAVMAFGAAGGAKAQTDTSNTSQDINNRRVTLNLDNADVKSALKLLFNSVGANFTIDPAVQGIVTVSLNDVTFRTALENILKSSSMPLTYRAENGVYTISVRPPQDESATMVNPDDNNPSTDTTPKPKASWRKIHLMYADAFDIAQIFGGQIIQSRLTQMSGLSGGYGNGYGGGGFGGGFGNNGYGNNGFGGGFGNMGGFGGGFGGFGGGFGNNSFGGGFGNNSFGGGFGNNNFGGFNNNRNGYRGY